MGGADAEAFQRMVMDLPEVEEREHANWVSLKVRGKGFCYLAQDGQEVLLKATREEQEALVAENPAAYEVAYTSGRFGWVKVRLAEVPVDELEELVVEAWRLSAPKRLAVAYLAGRG
ncbi:hypothetical protein SAMN04489712_105156 [Thermomonospora echinospora]|uniref:YjbR protein n=1 Tax=Thermomonospora echinospora TaxID=1992 RepID=A0A1H6A2Z2_9ACTN|nr:MmcQ/YjbR family DNA-binding protein [Thermomonospora echinospora]SEG42732.1 hypothetical protein SAMN04489712_105156 [Thermomonospora echinospora]